ncbi:MAG: hypothetical protein J0L87_01945 [Bacteroidetes bacterium]|nr:hypothetical protein [Bacteroidota bacterium]
MKSKISGKTKNEVSLSWGIWFFCVLFLVSPALFSQQTLNTIKGISFVKKPNNQFKEYYEVWVDQKLDHSNTESKSFKQRLFIGINNTAAPTVMETEGYAISNTSLPSFMNGCNYISVEHRYFGRSQPDSLNWDHLTIQQAASDLHHIRMLFGQVFTGKWMTTGISKGGQTALAYKVFFPEDVDATLAYVTPIKNSANDSRLLHFFQSISETSCGKKVLAFQKLGFRNKAALLNEFEDYIKEKKYTFSGMAHEKVLEYLLLEYPFAFYQNCLDCERIPDTTALPIKILEEIMFAVPPKFFSDEFRSKLEPSFYMFYRELGYYEYDTSPFKQWLSAENYSNNIFAPKNTSITFDTNYLRSLNAFIRAASTDRIIFIYGENDPYTSTRPVFANDNMCLVFVAKNGCHKSRIKDLTKEEQETIVGRLSKWLEWQLTK